MGLWGVQTQYQLAAQLPPLPASALPSQWLDPGVTVRGTAVLLLGPEPLIGPQQVVITHQNYPDRALRVVTDGLRPFTVESLP